MTAGHAAAAAVAIACLVCPAAALFAQAWPARPLRLIVPFAPGGNTDMIGRVLGIKLAEALGQQVAVENRPGAATLLGAEFVARAAPDGYTIMLATSTTLAINPHLYTKLPYDPQRDFAPIVLVAKTPLVLVVHPSLPVKSVRELVAFARARPGQLAYGSGGTGSQSFLTMQMLRSAAKLDMIEVPYKGSGPADIDLLGGQIPMMFQNTSLVHVKAGRLRALAHTGERPMGVYPGVPSFIESGFPGLVFYSWQGIVAPARTPLEILGRMNADLNRALKMPDVRERITADGAETIGGTPAEFADYIRAETVRFGQVIRAAGVKPE